MIIIFLTGSHKIDFWFTFGHVAGIVNSVFFCGGVFFVAFCLFVCFDLCVTPPPHVRTPPHVIWRAALSARHSPPCVLVSLGVTQAVLPESGLPRSLLATLTTWLLARERDRERRDAVLLVAVLVTPSISTLCTCTCKCMHVH